MNQTSPWYLISQNLEFTGQMNNPTALQNKPTSFTEAAEFSLGSRGLGGVQYHECGHLTLIKYCPCLSSSLHAFSPNILVKCFKMQI